MSDTSAWSKPFIVMSDDRYRLTDKHVDLRKWAVRGGLVEQQEDMATAAQAVHNERQQVLANVRSGEMVEYDILDRRYREEHPAKISEEELQRQIEYMAQAILKWEGARR